jgi:hypothetical protein
LTPAEFDRPWTIYTTPGLVLFTLIQTFLYQGVSMMFSFTDDPISPMIHIPWIIHIILISSVFPALGVIRTKLSVRQDGIDTSFPQVEPPAREYSVVGVVGYVSFTMQDCLDENLTSHIH